jgi:hypothetical protein
MKTLFEELIQQQQEKLLAIARRFYPNISHEDLLQPFDFPRLEEHPHFRYEEGVLQGLRMAEAAFRYESLLLFSTTI